MIELVLAHPGLSGFRHYRELPRGGVTVYLLITQHVGCPWRPLYVGICDESPKRVERHFRRGRERRVQEQPNLYVSLVERLDAGAVVDALAWELQDRRLAILYEEKQRQRPRPGPAAGAAGTGLSGIVEQTHQALRFQKGRGDGRS